MKDLLVFGKETTKTVPVTIYLQEDLFTIAKAKNVNLGKTLENVLKQTLPSMKKREPPISKENKTVTNVIGRPRKLTEHDEKRILEFIGLEGKWSKEIVAISGGNRNVTTKFLRKLIDKGLLESPARGFYRLPRNFKGE